MLKNTLITFPECEIDDSRSAIQVKRDFYFFAKEVEPSGRLFHPWIKMTGLDKNYLKYDEVAQPYPEN